MQESLSKTSSKRAVDLEFVDEKDLIFERKHMGTTPNSCSMFIVQSCYTKQRRGEEAASTCTNDPNSWKSTVKLLDTLIKDSDDSKLL